MGRLLIHISDLHIGSPQGQTRHDARKSVFDKLFDDMRKIKEERAIESLPTVITGDVFQHDTYYGGKDVAMFDYLIENLVSFGSVVIIPGNHDDNLANPSSVDLIGPLCVKFGAAVKYSKKTEQFTHGGFDFLHVSIFDPIPTAELERMVKANPGAIVLFHGRVDGSKYGRGRLVSDSRITTTVLDSVKLMMLGEYHRYQFVRPNVAYAGSLLQERVSEHPIKGYILWDYDLATGVFRALDNEKPLLKIDIKEGAPSAAEQIAEMGLDPTKVVASRVDVYTDPMASEECVANRLAEIYKLCGISALNNVNVINASNVKESTSAEHLDMLAEMLRSYRRADGTALGDENILAITELHKTALSNYDVETGVKWRILSMKWSNILAYGEDNYIDFTALENMVSGIIAQNTHGKTSIMDIIMFGLFNQVMRGNKIDLVHSGAKKMMVEIEFAVKGENGKYIVTRVDSASTHVNISFVFAPEASTDYVVLTEKSVDATYAKIRSKIGSHDQLLMTGLFYKPDKEFSSMTRGERLTLMSTLLGLGYYSKILDGAKREMKTLKDELSRLVKPRVTDPARHIADYNIINTQTEARIVEVTKELAAAKDRNEVARTKYAEIVKIHPGKTREQLTTQVSTLNASFSAASNELSKYLNSNMPPLKPDTMVSFDPAEIIAISKDLDYLRGLAGEQTRAVIDVYTELKATEKLLTREQLDNINSGVATYNNMLESYTQNAASTRELIGEINSKLSDLGPKVPIDQLLSVRSSNDLVMLQNEITRLTATIKPTNTDGIESLRNRLRNIQLDNKLTFDENCEACARNKALTNTEMTRIKTRLEREVLVAEEIEKHNAAVGDELAIVRAKCDDVLRQIKANEAALKTNDMIAELNHKLLQTVTVLNKYDDLIEITQKNKAAISEYIKLSAEYARASAVSTARDKVKKYDTHIMCENYRAYNSLAMTRDKIKSELDQAQGILAEIVRRDEERQSVSVALNTSSTEIKILEAEMSELQMKIGHVRSEITNMKNEENIWNEYNTRAPALELALLRQSVYKEVLAQNGLQFDIIKKSTQSLIQASNNFLRSVANFELVADIGDAWIDIYYVENSIKRPLDMASGYMKFAINIAMRLAVMMSSLTSPEFIFIDEGFGALDSTNMTKILDILSCASVNVKNMFVVSHRMEIQSILEYPIIIERLNEPGSGGTKQYSRIKMAGGGNNDNVAKLVAPSTTVLPVSDDLKPSPSMRSIINCPCGSVIQEKSRLAHMRTNKHKQWEASQKK